MSLIDIVTEKLLSGCNPFIIEFGSSVFRKCHTTGDESSFKLDSYSCSPSPEDTSLSHLAGKYVFNTEMIVESLIQLFGKKMFFEKYVSLIIPDQAFNFGVFSVPTVAAKTGIQPFLEREVQKISSLKFKDYSVKYEFGAKSGNKISVFYCALPLTTLNDVSDACAQAGVVPVAIQPSFVGIVKLLKLSQENTAHPSVFLHFGHEAITAGVFKGDGLHQIQVINIGVVDLLNRLVEDFNLTPEDAAKKLLGGLILLEDPSSEAQLEIPEYTILESVFAELLQRIYGFLLIYSNDNPDDAGFSKIILSGGGTKIKNIDRLIASNLGISTVFLSNELESSVNFPDLPEAEKLETLAPIIGNAMVQPWKTGKFERIFSA